MRRPTLQTHRRHAGDGSAAGGTWLISPIVVDFTLDVARSEAVGGVTSVKVGWAAPGAPEGGVAALEVGRGSTGGTRRKGRRSGESGHLKGESPP